jgi:hypothetical protein
VRTWLQDHGSAPKYGAGTLWNGDPANGQWLISVKGALLLYDLFQALTKAQEEYHKVEHGSNLTEWICQHDLEHFAELANYIQGLIKPNEGEAGR